MVGDDGHCRGDGAGAVLKILTDTVALRLICRLAYIHAYTDIQVNR